MKDLIPLSGASTLAFDVGSFEIDAFGRYDVADPEMLDIVAGGFRSSSGGGNNGCTQNGNCGCNNPVA